MNSKPAAVCRPSVATRLSGPKPLALLAPFRRQRCHLPPTCGDATSHHRLDDRLTCAAGTTNLTASLEDYDDEDETDVYLQSTGGRKPRRPVTKSVAEDYDIEEDWSALGRQVVSTTGLAKASAPQVGSGQQALQLMRPPSNPKIDRMRRDTYQPHERRLFRRDDDGHARGAAAAPPDARQRGAADTDAQGAAEASRRQLQQLPDLQLGKAALPGPSASGSHARGFGSRRDDAAEQEEARLEQALREAWRRSKQGSAEPKLHVQRPGQPTPQGTGDSKASSSGKDVRQGSATVDIPVFGSPQHQEKKASGRPVSMPSPGSSNSSILLTIASAMAADKREEEELSAIEDQFASLAQRISGPSQSQHTRGALKPRPTAPGSRPAASIAGSRQPPPPPPPAQVRRQQPYPSAEEKGPSSFQQALRSAVGSSAPQVQRPARPAVPTKPQPASMRENRRPARSEEEDLDSDLDLGAFSKAMRSVVNSGTQDLQRLNRPVRQD